MLFSSVLIFSVLCGAISGEKDLGDARKVHPQEGSNIGNQGNTPHFYLQPRPSPIQNLVNPPSEKPSLKLTEKRPPPINNPQVGRKHHIVDLIDSDEEYDELPPSPKTRTNQQPTVIDDKRRCMITYNLQDKTTDETHARMLKQEINKLQDLVQVLRDQQYILNILNDVDGKSTDPKNTIEHSLIKHLKKLSQADNTTKAESKTEDDSPTISNKNHHDENEIVHLKHEVESLKKLVNKPNLDEKLKTQEKEIGLLKGLVEKLSNQNESQTEPPVSTTTSPMATTNKIHITTIAPVIQENKTRAPGNHEEEISEVLQELNQFKNKLEKFVASKNEDNEEIVGAYLKPNTIHNRTVGAVPFLIPRKMETNLNQINAHNTRKPITTHRRANTNSDVETLLELLSENEKSNSLELPGDDFDTRSEAKINKLLKSLGQHADTEIDVQSRIEELEKLVNKKKTTTSVEEQLKKLERKLKDNDLKSKSFDDDNDDPKEELRKLKEHIKKLNKKSKIESKSNMDDDDVESELKNLQKVIRGLQAKEEFEAFDEPDEKNVEVMLNKFISTGGKKKLTHSQIQSIKKKLVAMKGQGVDGDSSDDEGNEGVGELISYDGGQTFENVPSGYGHGPSSYGAHYHGKQLHAGKHYGSSNSNPYHPVGTGYEQSKLYGIGNIHGTHYGGYGGLAYPQVNSGNTNAYGFGGNHGYEAPNAAFNYNSGLGTSGGSYGSATSGIGYGAASSGLGYGTGPSGGIYGSPMPGLGYSGVNPGLGYGTGATGGNYASPTPGLSYGAVNSKIGYGGVDSGLGYGAAATGNYGSVTSGLGYGASNSGLGYGTGASGGTFGPPTASLGYSTTNSKIAYGSAPSGLGYGTSHVGIGYGTAPAGSGYGGPSPVLGYGGTTTGINYGADAPNYSVPGAPDYGNAISHTGAPPGYSYGGLNVNYAGTSGNAHSGNAHGIISNMPGYGGTTGLGSGNEGISGAGYGGLASPGTSYFNSGNSAYTSIGSGTGQSSPYGIGGNPTYVSNSPTGNVINPGTVYDTSGSATGPYYTPAASYNPDPTHTNYGTNYNHPELVSNADFANYPFTPATYIQPGGDPNIFGNNQIPHADSTQDAQSGVTNFEQSNNFFPAPSQYAAPSGQVNQENYQEGAAANAQNPPQPYANPQQNPNDYTKAKVTDLKHQINDLQNIISTFNKPEYLQNQEDKETVYKLDKQITDLKAVMNHLTQDYTNSAPVTYQNPQPQQPVPQPAPQPPPSPPPPSPSQQEYQPNNVQPMQNPAVYSQVPSTHTYPQTDNAQPNPVPNGYQQNPPTNHATYSAPPSPDKQPDYQSRKHQPHKFIQKREICNYEESPVKFIKKPHFITKRNTGDEESDALNILTSLFGKALLDPTEEATRNPNPPHFLQPNLLDDVTRRIASIQKQLEFQPRASPPIYYNYPQPEKTRMKLFEKKDLKIDIFDKIFDKIIDKVISKIGVAIPKLIELFFGPNDFQEYMSGNNYGGGNNGAGYGNGYNGAGYGNGYNGAGYGNNGYSMENSFRGFGMSGFIPMIILKILSKIHYFVSYLQKYKFFKTFLIPALVLLLVAGSVIFLVWWLQPNDDYNKNLEYHGGLTYAQGGYSNVGGNYYRQAINNNNNVRSNAVPYPIYGRRVQSYNNVGGNKNII